MDARRLRGIGTSLAAGVRNPGGQVIDVVVAGAVGVAVAVPFLAAGPGQVTVLGAVLNAGTVLPLVWRRRAPFAVAIAVAIFATLVSLYDRPGQSLQYGGLVAIYTLADLGKRWQRLSFLGFILLTFPPASLLLKHNDATEFMFTLLLPLTAYLLGALARVNRAHTETLQLRAEDLERDRVADAARAAARERARIARDTHDVLAHAVAVMVVQAEAGPVVVRTDPDMAVRSFDVIADVGREAMAQLRHVLGVLKEDRDVGLRVPQPSSVEIPALVAQARTPGHCVALRVEGEPRRPPADVEVAMYRIVQESLTNTIKHASADSVDVRLQWEPTGVRVTVTDDGRTAVLPGGTAGRGLVGIRERAAATGGHATAGPVTGGGFRVCAWLPFRAGDRPATSPHPAA